MSEELFQTTAHAIIFALRYSRQQYAETPMSKLMKRSGSRSSGKGLSGNDGAGQAGMILKKIDSLAPLERACIVARYADRVDECPCCKQSTATDAYRDAVTKLADWAGSIENVTDIPRMRYAIVQDFYERRRLIGKAAESIGMPRQTAYDNRTRIHAQLVDLDKRALGQIEELLSGVVGEIA